MSDDRKRFLVYLLVSMVFSAIPAAFIGALTAFWSTDAAPIVAGAVFGYMLFELITRYKKLLRQYRG